MMKIFACTAALAIAAPLAAQDLSCERGDREVRSLRFAGNRTSELNARDLPEHTYRITAAEDILNDNPLVGLEGRADLMRRLGRTVAGNPAIFGRIDEPRPGGLRRRPLHHHESLATTLGVGDDTDGHVDVFRWTSSTARSRQRTGR